jgi:phosphopantetheinyl transferase (holo-ACP synthase)
MTTGQKISCLLHYVNVREYRRGKQKRRIRRNWQQLHKTNTNILTKTVTQEEYKHFNKNSYTRGIQTFEQKQLHKINTNILTKTVTQEEYKHFNKNSYTR